MSYNTILFVVFLSSLYLYGKYHIKMDFSDIEESEELVGNIGVPYKVKNRLERFSEWDIDFFRENYGEQMIVVLYSKNKACPVNDTSVHEMKMKEYIDNYIRGKRFDRERFYFKNEDSYTFLSDIGLDERISVALRPELPWHICLYYSFWMGPKGSATSFHYDTDYTNFLCVLEGKKRVLFIPPLGEDMIIPLDIKRWENWTEFDPEDERRVKMMKKKGYLCEIVVKKGEILNIPRNVWHAVINLEDTVAFTFHYATLGSVIYGSLYKVVSNTI